MTGRRMRRARGSALVLAVILMAMVVAFMATTVGLAEVLLRQESEATQRVELERLAVALEAYRRDVGALPPNLDALSASAAPGWKGPYVLDRLAGALVDEYRVDAWGIALGYTQATGRVTSGGRDRRLGTADDLAVEPAP